MKLSEIIKQYRYEHKLSMREFAKKCNVSNAYISLIESGETKSPTLEMISKLAVGMSLQTNALIELMNDDDIVRVRPKNVFTEVDTMSHKVQVYSHIPAYNSFDKIENHIGEITVPDKISKKNNLFGVKVKDDSMNKQIPFDSIAVFQRCVEVKQGDIVLVTIDSDDAIIRHYSKTYNGCILEPDSYNSEYEPDFITDGKNDVHLIGKLVWHCMDPNDIE